MTRWWLVLFLLTACSAAPTGYQQGSYDETRFGDLSGERSAPTALNLSAGQTTLSGTVIAGDIDYFTVQVPAGQVLSRLELQRYQSIDTLAFIAMQSGNTFTEPAAEANPAALLGYVLFGEGELGTNLLVPMGQEVAAEGFTVPLGEGTYTFWLQQTSGLLTEYTFEFSLAAE